MDKDYMRKSESEKIKLISREILLYLVEGALTLFEIFDKGRVWRRPIADFKAWREIDRQKFSQLLYQLKKQKLIEIYEGQKGKFMQLTNKGRKKLKPYVLEKLKIKSPSHWDGKWHLVIFDIPIDKNQARDVLRQTLERLGFLNLQKSVYVYPFNCFSEINFLRSLYEVESYVNYIIADHIEEEKKFLQIFFEKGILHEKMLKKIKK